MAIVEHNKEAGVRNAPSQQIAADLSCSGCGRPLVKDGKLKCTKCSCKCEVDATLEQKVITCSHCRGPKGQLRKLAVNDQALCPDRKCPNHKNSIGTPMRTIDLGRHIQMSQRTADRMKGSQTKTLHQLLNALERQVTTAEKRASPTLSSSLLLKAVHTARELNFDPDMIEKILGKCLISHNIETSSNSLVRYHFRWVTEVWAHETGKYEFEWLIELGTGFSIVRLFRNRASTHAKMVLCLEGKLAQLIYGQDAIKLIFHDDAPHRYLLIQNDRLSYTDSELMAELP